jgi:crotonobetainyl-CoA:carnitine CoA-transferase CaiB-like acyl-CoA transferase
MNPGESAASVLMAEIAQLSALLGRRVAFDPNTVLDRRGMLPLKPPGRWSANRSCRLMPTSDGWIAVNLARDTDRDMVPAWIGCGLNADPWRAIVRSVRKRSQRALLNDAHLLGLAVSGVGEERARSMDAPLLRFGAVCSAATQTGLHVIDLSSMWAGPLCGMILAETGAEVVKIESTSRPDAARIATPALFKRLNSRKRDVRFDFANADGRARLRDYIAGANILITSARPRAFEQFDLCPEAVFATNPLLVWVAVTGYGWTSAGAGRVAFGDDAAAAGGLVRWRGDGTPTFIGDALADPLTGLAAAVGAMHALLKGGGVLVDASMARCAAGAATLMAAHAAGG